MPTIRWTMFGLKSRRSINNTNNDFGEKIDEQSTASDPSLNNDRREALSTMTKNKKVLFKEDVNVCQFDCDGNVFRSDRQTLNVSLRDGPRLSFDDRKLLKSNEKLDWYDAEEYPSRSENDVINSILYGGPVNGCALDSFGEDVRPRAPSRLTVSAPEPAPTVDYRVVRDKLRGDLLVFCVTLGPGYDPKCVMVRASAKGRKIAVTACSRKPTPFSAKTNAPVKLEYHRRFSLPCTVDCGRVQARVDTVGNLTIEAAILT